MWLAVTGYVFYGYWNPKLCLLMLFSTLVNYGTGLGFLRWRAARPRARRMLLVVPITADLALRARFNYPDFANGTFN